MKKGAMFGLDCRVLRKQFGELFLTSRQSEAPNGANGSCGLTKRAAMFGLDARIALAIFGALSVISGAALYSAIKQAKNVSLVADISEVAKAVEQYILDVGSELPISATGPTYINPEALISNIASSNTWNGPYLSYVNKSDDNFSIWYVENKKNLMLYKRSINDSWGGVSGVDAVMPGTCKTTAAPCELYVSIGPFTVSEAESLDEYVDGVVGYKTGKLRIYQNSSGSYIYLLSGTAKETA